MIPAWIAWAIVAAPCAMLAWFTLEILAGLAPDRPGPAPGLAPCDLAVIVPAHDEALGIAGMLADLLRTVDSSAVIVVADNCSDSTADLARTAGVRVVERHDPGRRGKGFALAFAREALAAAPPQAVVVLDADCRVARGDPRVLAARAVRENCAVQAENVQQAPPGSSPLVQIGAFAFFVMNVVRAKGMERLGGGAWLQGTGMALPWTTFAQLHLASTDTVEDLGLSLQLARAGVPVRLDSRCAVTSESAGAAGHLDQRRRWELGFLRTGLRHGLPLVARGLATRSRLVAVVGAHLLVPPLALLFAVAAVALGASVGAHMLWGTSPWPALTLGAAVMLAGLAILAAWVLRGRAIVSFTAMAAAPIYILWKIPMYLGFGSKRAAAWNRADRSKAPGPSADS